MSGEVFELDDIAAFGQPHHGKILGDKLQTRSGVMLDVPAICSTPDTNLVRFPGLPDPVNSQTDLDNGIELLNYAIFFDKVRFYSPFGLLAFGARSHVFKYGDESWLIDFVVVEASPSPWPTWTPRIKIKSTRSDGVSTDVVPEVALSVNNLHWQGSNIDFITHFSPDGSKLSISAFAFPMAADASQRLDVRNSVSYGLVAVWELSLTVSDGLIVGGFTQVLSPDQTRYESTVDGTLFDSHWAEPVIVSDVVASNIDDNGNGTSTRVITIRESIGGQDLADRETVWRVPLLACYFDSNTLKVMWFQRKERSDKSATLTGSHDAGVFDQTVTYHLANYSVVGIDSASDFFASHSLSVYTTSNSIIVDGSVVAEVISTRTENGSSRLDIVDGVRSVTGASSSSYQFNGAATDDPVGYSDALVTANNSVALATNYRAGGVDRCSIVASTVSGIVYNGDGVVARWPSTFSPWVSVNPLTNEALLTDGCTWV